MVAPEKTLSPTRNNLLLLLAILGPGLVVMLADTDAGSIITAAQSGAVWGYKLLALQFILIPILFITQELTVRLGLVTGMGHGELIKHKFGSGWAWLSVATLLVSCVGAIITELSGIAGAGALFGIPPAVSAFAVVLFLIIIAWTGSYRSVERIALLIGAFELVFLYVAWKAEPSLAEIKQGFFAIPWRNPEYIYLAAANIGAVVMPWMIFYQQSALLDKGLNTRHLNIARWDTGIGAVITQSIMIAVLIITAATIDQSNTGISLNTVSEISQAITPTLGNTVGRLLFALGITGAALVAAIVVSLTAGWGLGEITGFRRSLQDHPKDAPWFYGTYSVTLIIGGIIVSSGINLVNLSVAVEVMNALLLPIVLGFLYLLARKTLPEAYRLKGVYGMIVGILLFITSFFGLFAGIWGSVT
jgi:NRAMP (natural resistance-associated macrophage protein)-like metal ion transporter